MVYTLGTHLKTSERKKVPLEYNLYCYSRCITFPFQPLLLPVRLTDHWSTFNENNKNHLIKGGFPLGEMTCNFATKSGRNYFAT